MFDRYDEVAFVGATLGPLFAADPADVSSARQVATFAALDVDAAATEWPFVAEERARKSLAAMREGAEDADSEALVWEYRRLFVGPGAMPVPPWGSVYTDRECVVFGEATLALRSWMKRNGIARQGDEKTPEDHIGLMLLLMAWIAFGAPPELWRGWGCFLALSSAFAGAVYGISLLSGAEVRGMLSGASLKTLALSFGLCYAAVRLFFGRFLKRRERCVVEAKIELCGKTVSLRALRDTGNSLFDPLSGSRILLAEPGALASLFVPPLVLPLPDDPAACFRVLSSHPVLSRRLRLVGFSAVGTKRGLLVCFRPDAVTVEGVAEQYLVALSPTPLGGGEYSALV